MESFYGFTGSISWCCIKADYNEGAVSDVDCWQTRRAAVATARISSSKMAVASALLSLLRLECSLIDLLLYPNLVHGS